MRHFLLCALVWLSASSALALSCVNPHPIWWPQTETIPSDAVVALLVDGLGDNFYDVDAAWFEAGDERIEGIVETIGQQTVIRPMVPLTAGLTYTLVGQNGLGYRDGLWRVDGGEQVPVTWTVSADEREPPRWTADVRVGESEGSRTDWGDVSRQTLHLAFEASEPPLVEVILERDDERHTLLRTASNDRPLIFGAAPCVVDVNLLGVREWTAMLTLIGVDGARSEPQTVTFSVPVSSDCAGCAQRPGESASLWALLLGVAAFRRRRSRRSNDAPTNR